jgi:ABC-type lipoprotein release transport system permease subunit
VCAGFFVAYWLSTTLVAWLSTDNSRIVLNRGADRRTFAVLSALALVACAIFGVSPALRATAAAPADALQPGGRSATGAACGVALAALAARSAAGLLYGIDALDAPSFAAAAALLWITGLLAAWVPARRAARVAPTVAIRD